MDKASELRIGRLWVRSPSWLIIFNSLFIDTYCCCTTEANGKSWTIGIHDSFCFDCNSETFGNIYCIFTMDRLNKAVWPMDKASDFESEDCGVRSPSWSIILKSLFIHHIVVAQLRSWTIGIHGSYCFDCISETFGNIYCIFTMTG